MKKNTFKKAISAVAVSALALTASSVSAFAAITDKGVEYGLDPKDGSAAAVKPHAVVTKEVLKADEAANKIVKVTIDIEGAEGTDVKKGYCTTGFHVYWDDRLTVVPDEDLEINAVSGNAITSLGKAVENNGANGLMLATDGSADLGLKGTMWTIQLKVPADAKAGDVYPIDIAYQWDPSKGDLFTDNKDSAQGKLMQAYFFTKGINSATNPSDDPYLVSAGATFADGYIAVEGPEETTTTTTSTAAPGTTTTAPASSTSTAAPGTTTTAPASSTSTAAPGTTTTAPASSTSTAAASSTGADSSSTAKTTTGKSGSDNKKSDSPKTGVTGVGVAAAGLAVAIGTAFALKKKED
ncbi:MAG: NPXTG-anchored protein [Ruminococcus sp.]|nr:NPXTG-anchored protein [Ruminococcus sp.]